MSLFDLPASFWEHVEELRNTLVKCLFAIVFATAASFLCFDQLYPLITSPLKAPGPLAKTVVVKERIKNSGAFDQKIKKPAGKITYFSKNAGFTEDNFVTIPPYGVIEWETEKNQSDLVLLGPMEGMVASLKISLWAGLFLASPFCGFFILQFIYPALRSQERFFALPFAFLSLLFLFLGGAFALGITVPFTNQVLSRYNESLGLNLWSVSHYFDYTIIMILSTGVAFELSLILLFLVHYGKVSEDTLKRVRPIAYVGTFVLSAILTPPDIFTQICLAVPLAGIYEASIIYAKIRRHFVNRNLLLLKNMD
jgi:sec-independent protein translocase protein TatC